MSINIINNALILLVSNKWKVSCCCAVSAPSRSPKKLGKSKDVPVEMSRHIRPMIYVPRYGFRYLKIFTDFFQLSFEILVLSSLLPVLFLFLSISACKVSLIYATISCNFCFILILPEIEFMCF